MVRGFSAVIRDFVREVVRSVVVHAEKIVLEASASALRAMLLNPQEATSGQAKLLLEANSEDLVRLSIETRLKRCGTETRLVLSPNFATTDIVTPIMKTILRAYKWRENVLSGNSSNEILLTKRLALKGEYLRRVLGCAFLAPDILEAILDGDQPAGLTVKKLSRRRLPLDWAEQRIQLGFPRAVCR